MKKSIGLTGLMVALMVVGGFMAGCGGSDDKAQSFDFAGVVTGTWQGSHMSGTFAIVVSPTGSITGSFSGNDNGLITGTVDSNGSFAAQAAGSAGIATWGGQLTSANGVAASGNGTWAVASRGLSGTWSGAAVQ